MEAVTLPALVQGLVGSAALLVVAGLFFFVFEVGIPWLRLRYAGTDRASTGPSPDWRLQRDVGFFKRDLALEVALPIVNKAIELTLLTAPIYTLMSMLQPQLPQFVLEGWIYQLPFAAQVLCGMLVMDLAVYAEHRFIHRFAWPFHAIHHSAEEVTWLTSLRVHPGNVFTIALFNSSIGWVLGFSGEAWALGLVLMSFLSMFQHANLDWDWWGPFRYFVVSPNFHKWHHAQREEAVAKNLCLAFPFIDVLFGTFYYPRDEKPSGFGIYDRPGEMPLEGGLLTMLWYPFRRCIAAVRGWGS